jgi:molecular chaperone GrpE
VNFQVATKTIMKKQDIKNEIEEWKAKYLRAIADYQNLERRNREEKEEVRKYAGEVILGRMLSAIDTLQKAKDHIKDTGLDLACNEFTAVLQEHGVEKMHTVGEVFDPHQMECIEVVEGEDNTVIEELLPGYRYHGKVLRVAQVKVGKKNSLS